MINQPNHQPANEQHQPESTHSPQKEIILVTGSSGLIGSSLIRRLASEYTMIGFDHAGPPYPPEEAVCINNDITSRASIDESLAQVREQFGNRIASVVHLAAYYDFSGEPSPLYEKLTVQGTKHLLEALQSFEVEQFIFSSSMLIYKPTTPGHPLDETAPLAPAWDYPKSKVRTETVIHEQRGSIPAVILRIAGVYNETGHSVPVVHQIQRIYERTLTSHFYSGDTASGNSFVHLEDAVDAIELAIRKRHQLEPETILNIGEETPVSYGEIQETTGQLLYGTDWTTIELPKLLAKVGAAVQDLVGDPFIKPWMIDRADDHYELNIDKARQVLDWHPRHSLSGTLPTIINNLKENPVEWYRVNELELPDELKEKQKGTL
ncbi:NAD(P)-dependent oxidoreductase [Spirosoma taeanense]|uniref:NAD(P)-dependent oxidoreductase n=1 Tax=Spirosoma taeanense TaxID=2735870 RepID=A0A6M5YB52_9BACT|nr:NAD(P)-dependent oxidoreductase [Spirosoma taeanense]QJW91199.1 NAD(P)-dependent oxidoreductase [Spirosoma taeanense]